MTWRLIVTPRVQETLRTFPPQTKRYIRNGLDEIRENPKRGKELKDDLTGFYSYRARQFRIIYRIHRGLVTVFVVAVGPRKTIYHDLISGIHAS